jgi:hypothetical protein
MKTLKDIIVDRKTRKGESTRITKDGAYWETAILFAAEGGDGIGQASSDVSWYLEIRHYRDGHLRGYVNRHTWHQNDGDTNNRTRSDDVLNCTTIEELIVTMQHHVISYDWGREDTPIEVRDWGRGKLAEGLPEIPESEKAPDEI